eukprot:CAMPEP_0179415086 /NCGR_PEP_ID=MMETSP0799-20121207/6036_1 /TAXON_ID=46947 /ORGANISM="Geminigera cryophila, Strain CCMP2564" /LENGTH=464 /DNA_ID=CAMNT_0021187785 /DNA_START=359 /DNA_END=1753 /DNA_ORIENTATION=-
MDPNLCTENSKYENLVAAGFEQSDGYDDGSEEGRESEKARVRIEGSTRMVISNVEAARRQAVLNLLQVTFVILLLSISGYSFQNDTERLIIRPLAKMAKIVENLSVNPLARIPESDEKEEHNNYETAFVERALKKFVKLLQVAFGEAGSEIIGQNLGADGDLNPMIAGRKMSAIFGFAIVRNFSECTECLQEDVMVFVNTIADIVHRAVKENEGAPNKNIGEAFLLVWRLNGNPDITRPVGTVADSALKSFIRASLEVQASEHLRKVTDHHKIQDRLPGYNVSLGFGLHVGWAIEGAIGSMLKIDASYLSPNVNMAARLESGCNQFDVDILISEDIYNMLSMRVQELCRRLDRVTVKGSELPMNLYTYDVPPNTAKALSDLAITQGTDFWEQFKPFSTPDYRVKYAKAVDSYLDGKWDVAKCHLNECVSMWPEDGAAKVLTNVMRKSSFVAPEDWKGFRALTSK